MNTQTALRRCFNYFMDMNHEPGYRGDSCVYYANGSDPVPGKVDGGIGSLYDAVPETNKLLADSDQNTLAEMQVAHDKWAEGTNDYLGIPMPITRETFLDYLQLLMCFHKDNA